MIVIIVIRACQYVANSNSELINVPQCLLQELTTMRCWLEWSVMWHPRVCRAVGRQLANAPARHTSDVMCPTTNHSSQQRMNGQFLFYHEYEAIDFDKTSDVGATMPNRPG